MKPGTFPSQKARLRWERRSGKRVLMSPEVIFTFCRRPQPSRTILSVRPLYFDSHSTLLFRLESGKNKLCHSHPPRKKKLFQQGETNGQLKRLIGQLFIQHNFRSWYVREVRKASLGFQGPQTVSLANVLRDTRAMSPKINLDLVVDYGTLLKSFTKHSKRKHTTCTFYTFERDWHFKTQFLACLPTETGPRHFQGRHSPV